jgi:putative membrane protein insertion efficiency factor
VSSTSNPVRTLLIWAVRAYQTLVSPALPRSCKYHPSCSQYAIDAFSQYGVFRGFVLATWRLMRCNPLSYGGYDPVERQRLFEPRPVPRADQPELRVNLARKGSSLHSRKHENVTCDGQALHGAGLQPFQAFAGSRSVEQ